MNTTSEETTTYPGVTCDDDASALMRLILPPLDCDEVNTLLAYSERETTSHGNTLQWFLLEGRHFPYFRLVHVNAGYDDLDAPPKRPGGKWSDEVIEADKARAMYDRGGMAYAGHIYRCAPRPDFETQIEGRKQWTRQLEEARTASD